ncbi:MAG: 4Fe-4S dicluster domain-containing protein [Spirochaetaceae bacterium]|nr:4Fe-4S dicluster domain-containing protein [Spirochaetaceae bacterium]
MLKTLSLLDSLPTLDYELKQGFLPPVAAISLCQDSKTILKPIVKKGDKVQEGQCIGFDEGISIHASIPGEVVDFVSLPMINRKKTLSVLIKMDGSFTHLGRTRKNTAFEEIIAVNSVVTQRLAQNGVINTFDKPRSLAEQIKTIKNQDDTVLFVRLFDEDPSVITDTFITQQYFSKIFEASALLANEIKAQTIYFFHVGTVQKPTDDLFEKYFKGRTVDFVTISNTKYPFGSLSELTRQIKKLNKSVKKNDAVLAIDATTALGIYEAVVENKPILDKIITVSGDALVKNLLIKVRLGTSLRKIIDECGGFITEPKKIVVNGLIKGKAISFLDTPITKDIKSITIVSKKRFPVQEQYPCIRCGRCYYNCPEKIRPLDFILVHKKQEKLSDKMIEDLKKCTACGACKSGCSSRIPLYQIIEQYKEIYEK